jgi:hypothetical protein
MEFTIKKTLFGSMFFSFKDKKVATSHIGRDNKKITAAP